MTKVLKVTFSVHHQLHEQWKKHTYGVGLLLFGTLVIIQIAPVFLYDQKLSGWQFAHIALNFLLATFCFYKSITMKDESSSTPK